MRKFLYPYILFQMLYLVFQNIVLQHKMAYQISTPYWILWYLFVLMAWNMLIPLLEKLQRWEYLVMAMTVVLSLGIGYLDSIGRTFSLSRMIVFFPFFVMGYYYRLNQSKGQYGSISKTIDRYRDENKYKRIDKHWIMFSIVVLGVILSICIKNAGTINRNWLYEATAYAESSYSIYFRLFHIIMAVLWIGILMILMPDRKLPIVTQAGMNTMSVYLLHGFIIKSLADSKVIIQLLEESMINTTGLETIVLLIISVIIASLFSTQRVTTCLNVILLKKQNKI